MSSNPLLDFSWWGLALQLVGAVVITGFAAAALCSLTLGRGVLRARLLVAEGVIGGLGVMTAATLLRTIGLRTWHQILMFTLILSLRILLKKLFVWEKQRLFAAVPHLECTVAMPSKVSASRLHGVPETLLLPLYNRALESKRASAIVRDEKAIELLGRIDYDFSRFGRPHVGFPVRARRMDDIVLAFLARFPDGVVVNLGGGLDTQFYRVDNGRVLWFEIDLPESTEVRREFFEETTRHRMIACSALDFRWMDEIGERSPAMFVAAGLLPYFPPEEVKRLVATLATRFQGSEMVFDTVSEWFSKLSLKGKAKIGEFILPPMPWGMNRNDLSQIESWQSGIEIVSRADFTVGYRLRWGIIGIASALPFVANKFHACTVHMRFKQQG